MTEIRNDAGTLAKPVRLPNGGAIVEGRVARAGPHVYRNDDGSERIERRSLLELKLIVQQLAGKPITIGHPAGMISDGATAAIVGRVDSARLEGDHAVCTMTIADARALDAGRELSLGYKVAVDALGNHNGTRVDHLALVPRARCGPTCSVRTDCASACTCNRAPAVFDRERAILEVAAAGVNITRSDSDEIVRALVSIVRGTIGATAINPNRTIRITPIGERAIAAGASSLPSTRWKERP